MYDILITSTDVYKKISVSDFEDTNCWNFHFKTDEKNIDMSESRCYKIFTLNETFHVQMFHGLLGNVHM